MAELRSEAERRSIPLTHMHAVDRRRAVVPWLLGHLKHSSFIPRWYVNKRKPRVVSPSHFVLYGGVHNQEKQSHEKARPFGNHLRRCGGGRWRVRRGSVTLTNATSDTRYVR
jgi:hypothetical protein